MDLLPAVERGGRVEVHPELLSRFDNRLFGSEQFSHAFAFDVYTLHETVDRDAQRQACPRCAHTSARQTIELFTKAHELPIYAILKTGSLLASFHVLLHRLCVLLSSGTVI